MKNSKFTKGHRVFKDTYFEAYEDRFKELVENGQKPKALFIGCSDSRMMPNLITNSKPGELFTVRNVGNFVPPYQPNDDFHGTAAGIEYAVSVLNVNNIIVCGHSHCGACEAIYNSEITNDPNLIHVNQWLKIGEPVKKDVLENFTFVDDEQKLRITERISIIHQLQNLLTYPRVKQRVEDGTLKIHGWYYILESGELEGYNAKKDEFIKIS